MAKLLVRNQVHVFFHFWHVTMSDITVQRFCEYDVILMVHREEQALLTRSSSHYHYIPDLCMKIRKFAALSGNKATVDK